VLRFELTRDAEAFADRVRPFLAERLERNILATITESAAAGAYVGRAMFSYGLDDADQVAYAALRTPPWFMLTSEIDATDAKAVVEAWLTQDPDLPGVDATPGAARAVAAAWSELTGGTATLRMSEKMHSLTEVVDPPHPATGALRQADRSDRDLLIDWEREFVTEAGLIGDGDAAAAATDRRLSNGLAYVWEDGGPVSFLGMNRPIAGVVRIGPVYTPPEHRRRGYAGTAVAAASRLALSNGARACMLLTDDTNPTSNKIYAEVGYEVFGAWEEYAFERPGA
jgi:predicted GNAT family acetyltransferase